MGEDARAAAKRWAQTWQAGWATHDKEAIISLYATNARFQPHPFRPPRPIDTYLDEVFEDEVSAEPIYDEPLVDGRLAAVHWRARTELRSGVQEKLTGVSMLVFDAAGLVTDHQDFWTDGAAL